MAQINNSFNLVGDNINDTSEKVFTISVANSGDKTLNTYNENWSNNNNHTIFDVSSLGNITITCNKTDDNHYALYSIEIVIDDIVIEKIRFTGGDLFWITYSSVGFNIELKDTDPSKFRTITISPNEKTIILDGNPYYHSNIASKIDKNFTENGRKPIRIIAHYKVFNYSNNGYYSEGDTLDESHIVAYLDVLNPTIKSISVSNGTRMFYKNQTFNYNGLVVYGFFSYQVNDTTTKLSAYSTEITGYTVMPPLMGISGTKKVYVYYENISTSYNIFVAGVSSFSIPSFQRNNLRIGEAILNLPTTTITYDDGTTETSQVVAGAYDNTVAGVQQIEFFVFATKTDETLSFTKTFVFCELESITLSGNYPTQFNYNDTFSYSGLVVVGNYGQAGNEVALAQDIVVSANAWEVGTNILVNVYYKGKTATYNINIDGLNSARVFISNENKRCPLNKTFNRANILVYYTKYQNGVLSAETLWEGAKSISGDITSSIGIKELSVSISYLGKTITLNENIVIYDYSNINVSNAPTTLYYEGTTYPTLDLSKMVVSAHTTDGYDEVLTLNALSKGYTTSPASGATINQDTQVVITTTDIQKTTSFLINIEENKPAQNATISVGGSLTKTTYEVGETVDLSGLIVRVSEMTNGATNVVYNDYTATITGKNRLYFTSQDSVGIYSITITISGIANPYILQTDIILNGIVDIDNISISKTTYIAGLEEVNPNNISYRVRYMNGNTENRTGATNLSKTSFTYADAGSYTLSFKVEGESKTLNLTILSISSISVFLSSSQYNWGDAFNKQTASITLTYSDGSTKIAQYNSDKVSYAIQGDTLGATLLNLKPQDYSKQYAKIRISFTEGGKTVYQDVNVNVKTLVEITLYDNNGNVLSRKNNADSTLNSTGIVVVNYGDVISLTNFYVAVKFNDNTTQTLETFTAILNNENVIGKVNKNITSVQPSITSSFGTQNITLNFIIHTIYTSDITVDFSSLNGTHYVNDNLSLSGITATKTISSTNAQDTSYPQTETITENLEFVFNYQNVGDSIVLPSVGTFVLNANYEDDNGQPIFSKSQNISVIAIVLQSISLAFAGSWKSFSNYFEEQNLDLTGLSVNLVYNKSQNNKTLSWNNDNIKLVDGNNVAFSKNKVLTLADSGKELFIKYSENGVYKSAKISRTEGSTLVESLTVGAKELSSIQIITQPQLTFTYGDTFNVDNAQVKLLFNNGSNVITNIADNNLTISGKTLGHIFDETDGLFTSLVRSFTFTITYTYVYEGITKTTTNTITLIPPVIDYLKTNYQSDAVVKSFKDKTIYSANGLVITAVMQNGWEKTLSTFTTNAESVLHIDSDGKIQIKDNDLDYGTYAITITGTNPYTSTDIKTTSYNVDITSSNAVVSATLTFDENVEYNKYFVGDTYNAKGITFTVRDIDGNQWIANSFTTSIPIGEILRSAKSVNVKCTFTSGSFTTTQEYTINIGIKGKSTYTETNNYKIAIGYSNGSLFTSITHEEANIVLGKVYDSNNNLIGEYYPVFLQDKISIDTNSSHTNTYGFNVYTGNSVVADCIGYLDMGLQNNGEIVRNAHLILFSDVVNPIEGQGNIVVKYPHYVSGLADRINKSKIGVVFNHRLFVSGNEDYKNCDWHSGAIDTSQIDNYNNDSNTDYSYFSDLDYCYYGGDDTAIVGYDTFYDGNLIVVKEGSKNQATIYRRTHSLVQATSYDGNAVSSENEYVEDSFPMFDINSNGGVGGISQKGIVNFVGETIILTKNGIKCLSSDSATYNNAKFTKDVSSYINPKIIYEGLENAMLYAFNQKLILKTDRGIYVGYYELRNDNSEYEWYFLDEINADYIFEFNEELYFSNKEGSIYRFSKELIEYLDKQRIFIGTGGTYLSIDEVNNKIIASLAYKQYIIDGNSFHLKTTYTINGIDVKSLVHGNLGKFINKETVNNVITQQISTIDLTLYDGIIDKDLNVIEVKPLKADATINLERLTDIQDLFYDGRKVYADQITGDSYTASIDNEYHLSKYDKNNPLDYRFKVIKNDGTELNLTGLVSFRLSYIVNQLAITKITEVQDYGTSGAKSFKLLGDHDKIIDLIYYNGRNDRYSGVITSSKNVESYYITAPYVLDSLVYEKTIWLWTIANDTNLASYMDVGFLTNKKQGDYEMIIKSSAGSKQLNFSGFSFDKVQFTSDKLPHLYTRNRILPSVGFIRFVFKNDKPLNMVLTTLQLVYTYSQLTKGVK